jgi:predicted small secreted protein
MNRPLIITIIACSMTLTACASIMHGTSQDIGISSSPTNASVTIDNQTKAQTPFVAKLSRKDNHIIRIAADGFAPADLTLTRSTSGWVWGNVLFGGLIGLAVDAISGGLYNLTPAQLTSTLAKQSATIDRSNDGIYVLLVPAAEAGWTKVGQLRPNVDASKLGN